MSEKAVHLYISGRVQGVGYRYSAFNQAQKLGIRGWVRNLPDGRVEMFLEGEEKPLDMMVSWCHKGPQMSFVTSVEVYKKEFKGEFKEFSIAR